MTDTFDGTCIYCHSLLIRLELGFFFFLPYRDEKVVKATQIWIWGAASGKSA